MASSGFGPTHPSNTSTADILGDVQSLGIVAASVSAGSAPSTPATPDFGEMTDKEFEEMLTLDRRKKTAYDLYSKQVPVNTIAKHFRVASSTVYNWIKDYRDSVTTRYTSRTRSDLLLDSISFLELIRDGAMMEVHNVDLRVASAAAGTGKSLEGRAKLAELATKRKFMELAVDANTHIFTELLKTGVLPNAVKEMHCSFEATRPVVADSRDVKAVKSREELEASILDLLRCGRTIDIKDEAEEEVPDGKYGKRLGEDAGDSIGTGTCAGAEASGDTQQPSPVCN